MAEVLGDPKDVAIGKNGTRSGSFDLVVDFERPPSQNKSKSHANKWTVVGDTARWLGYGSDMILMARNLGHPRRVDRFGVTVRQLAKDGRAHQDVGNCMPAIKAMIDGFVVEGFVPDDVNKHLTFMTFKPTAVTDANGLQVIVAWEIDA